MKPSIIFEKAANLLEKSELTREWYAVDKKGRRLNPCLGGAVGFCLVGACARVAKGKITSSFGGTYQIRFGKFEMSLDKYIRPAARMEKGVTVTEWSDTHKKKDVVAVLRRAAKLARKAGE